MNENSGFLRIAIYAFTVLWCHAVEAGSWLATFRFNIRGLSQK